MQITISSMAPISTYVVNSTMSGADVTSSSVQQVDPISEETLNQLLKFFNASVIAISVTGICTNFQTMRTFRRMGLQDSMTISFFFLALLDFSTCIFVLTATVCETCNILVNEGLIVFDIPLYVPYFYINSSRIAVSITTSILKVYMAIQRCLCVALPFHVRGLFTRVRTIVFMVVLSAYSVCWTLLFIFGHTFKTITIPMYNISYPVLFRRAELEIFVDRQEFINSVVLSTGSQVISLVCVIVMIMALKKSARFRKSVTNFSQSSKKVDIADEATEKANSKEKQVLIQVVFLTGVFCFTGGLYMVQGLCTLLIPGYAYTQEYHNLYMTVYSCALVFEMLNSTGNCLIYLKFNSRFRKLFLSR